MRHWRNRIHPIVAFAIASSCVPVIIAQPQTAAVPATEPSAPLKLPDAFIGGDPSSRGVSGKWQTARMNVDGVEFSFDHPEEWVEVHGIQGTRGVWFSPDRTRTVTLFPPQSSNGAVTRPGTESDLRRFADAASQAVGKPVVQAGQAQAGTQLWLWIDLGDVVPTDRAALSVLEASGAQGGVGTWVFATTFGSKQFTIMFQALHLRAPDSDQLRGQTNASDTIFKEVLERLSFK